MLSIPALFPPYLSLWQLKTSFQCLLISHCFESVDDEMNVVDYPFAVMGDIRRKQALAIAVIAYLLTKMIAVKRKKFRNNGRYGSEICCTIARRKGQIQFFYRKSCSTIPTIFAATYVWIPRHTCLFRRQYSQRSR